MITLCICKLHIYKIQLIVYSVDNNLLLDGETNYLNCLKEVIKVY